MNFFKRLYKMGQAEANSILDSMEDPIKITEQGIRDLKEELEERIESLAQVKALAIRAKNEYQEYVSNMENYQDKALLLLNKAKNGDLELSEAERLARVALQKKEENSKAAENVKKESFKFESSVLEMEATVLETKKNIARWENELKTLKARVKVSNATKKMNKQMADVEASGTVDMLEKMKHKVSQEEALAEAYGNISDNKASIDFEIDKAIDFTKDKTEGELIKLKQQLGFSNDFKS